MRVLTQQVRYAVQQLSINIVIEKIQHLTWFGDISNSTGTTSFWQYMCVAADEHENCKLELEAYYQVMQGVRFHIKSLWWERFEDNLENTAKTLSISRWDFPVFPTKRKRNASYIFNLYMKIARNSCILNLYILQIFLIHIYGLCSCSHMALAPGTMTSQELLCQCIRLIWNVCSLLKSGINLPKFRFGMHQVLKRVNAKGCNDSTWYLIVYKVIKLKETPPSQ